MHHVRLLIFYTKAKRSTIIFKNKSGSEGNKQYSFEKYDTRNLDYLNAASTSLDVYLNQRAIKYSAKLLDTKAMTSNPA
jgi:hypothetical protein